MKTLVTTLTLLAYAGELIPQMANTLATQQDDLFDKMIAGKYLGRLQLMTSASEKCKSGEFPINHYAYIVGEKLVDLGKEVDCLVVSYRFKALDMSGESVAVSYDPNSPLFAEISNRADNTPNSKCTYGPEFLVYLPKLQKFATFHMGSKTARKVSADVRDLLCKAMTLGSRMIQNKDYSWAAPTASPCHVQFALPDTEKLQEENLKFMNPPAEAEMAPAATRET